MPVSWPNYQAVANSNMTYLFMNVPHSWLTVRMDYLVDKQTAGYLMSKIKRWFWSKDDLRTLKSLAREKTPAPRIAKQLKRSLGAVRQKAMGLGISLDSRP